MKRNDWENQYVLQINREPMHVPLGAYSSEVESDLQQEHIKVCGTS